MKILFITFGELSLREGNTRSVAILRALADAGHQVDVLASSFDISDHPRIRLLPVGFDSGTLSRRRLRLEVLKAIGRDSYDAIHAVDDAVLFASGICKWKKIRLIYDAERRFAGPVGRAPSSFWKLFPGYFVRVEKKILAQSSVIFSTCDALTLDLLALDKNLEIIQVEDIPVQPLFPARGRDKSRLLKRFSDRPSSIVVCSFLPETRTELRKLLVATRKVIESTPQVVFFFKGASVDEAKTLATNLDILERCVFFAPSEIESFLVALDVADVSLLATPAEDRYVHSDVFTLLHSPAPLVLVQNGAYSPLLNENNCIQVLSSSESISEGIIRAIHEPLFSLGIAREGRQLIADKHSFSSFKHKVRMAYHELRKAE